MTARIVTIILFVPTAYLTVFVLNQPLLTFLCLVAFSAAMMIWGESFCRSKNEKPRANETFQNNK